MNRKQKIEKVYRFIHSCELAALATIEKAAKRPTNTLVAFADTKNLRLVFGTLSGTRKYTNLKKNKNVALVIGWDAKVHITVQYEGKAAELRGREVGQAKALLRKKKTPFTEKFRENPRMRFFKITPTWIGYSDYTKKVPEVFELSFLRLS